MIVNRHKLQHRSKQRGQTMVEFALAFPIFLMIVLGIFEFGRLFFIYTSIYSAAREGARYGAAVENQNDCGASIEAQAQRVGFIAGDINVVYFYDHGPGTSTFPCSIGGTNLENGDRVMVRTSVVYKSVTGIVPTFTIESTSRRTIIKKAYLQWTLAAPGTTATPYPTRPPGATDTPIPSPAVVDTPTVIPSPPIGSTPTPTFTPTVANACVGSMQIIEQPESSVVMVTLNNDLDIILQLDYIKVSWTANDRYLSKITYSTPSSGSQIAIWQGVGSSSPFYFTFDPKIPINPGVTNFYFYFTKNNANVTDVEMNFQAESGERCDIINTP